MASSDSIINLMFNENDWLIHVQDNLKQDLENVIRNPFCIFRVPESLSASKPETYTPQLIGLGPYHHLRSELYQMEAFKLVAAKKAILRLQVFETFQHFVDKLEPLLTDIRLSYDKYLGVRNGTLAWIMAIDGLFLLELFHNRAIFPYSSERNFFVDYAGTIVRQNTILKDVMMLENQIPMSVLLTLINNNRSSNSEPFSSMLVDFCKEFSPLELLESSQQVKPKHLLDLLYQLIWLKGQAEVDANQDYSLLMMPIMNETPASIDSELWNEVRDSDSAVVKVMTNSGALILRSVGILGIYTYLKKAVAEDTALVPAATDLIGVGVKFRIAADGIRSISYNKEDKSLKLPVFTWNPTCEVILRNLVAYESITKSTSLVLSTYVELMNGIVRTTEDVEFLKKENIIIAGDADIEEVVELFSGMGSSRDSKGKTFLDDTIKAVNEHYNSNCQIKVYKVLKKYVRFSWKVLVVIAAILLLLLLVIQALCDIISCPTLLGTSKYLKLM